jgi:predicted ester cyclase
MSIDKNIQMIKAMLEASNAHDAERQSQFFHVAATNHGRPAGRDGLRKVLGCLYETFPDWHYDLHQVASTGNSVMAMMTMSGTHKGVARMTIVGGLIVGVEPTNRSVSVLHCHYYRFEDDMIIEHSAVRDDLGMMQQLGLIGEGTMGDISRTARQDK